MYYSLEYSPITVMFNFAIKILVLSSKGHKVCTYVNGFVQAKAPTPNKNQYRKALPSIPKWRLNSNDFTISSKY